MGASLSAFLLIIGVDGAFSRFLNRPCQISNINPRIDRIPISTRYCVIIRRNIAFACVSCEDEECGAIPSNAAISLCESPSRTASRKTLPYPSGNLSIILSNSSQVSSRALSTDAQTLSAIAVSDMGTEMWLDSSFRYWSDKFFIIEVSQASIFTPFFREPIDVKAIRKPSCNTSCSISALCI